MSFLGHVRYVPDVSPMFNFLGSDDIIQYMNPLKFDSSGKGMGGYVGGPSGVEQNVYLVL